MVNDITSRTFEIFISYSHHDVATVKPIVQLLRSAGSQTFLGEDSIPPGKKWRIEISTAIEDCRLLYLFWCSHAAISHEVCKEYKQAINLQKNIIPVLLDDTPLPKQLSEFQWIDLREALGKHEETKEQTISCEEDLVRMQLNRESHQVPKGAHAYTDGEFYRLGWEKHGNQWVRRIPVLCVPADSAILVASKMLLLQIIKYLNA